MYALNGSCPSIPGLRQLSGRARAQIMPTAAVKHRGLLQMQIKL